jgi:hypothetical protein
MNSNMIDLCLDPTDNGSICAECEGKEAVKKSLLIMGAVKLDW